MSKFPTQAHNTLRNPKNTTQSPRRSFWHPLSPLPNSALTLLLLASVFLFNTNASCHKPTSDQNSADETVPTQYTAAQYKNTGACNNPDFLFERNTETHEYTNHPDAVGTGKGDCNADGLKNGQWNFQYKDYNTESQKENKRSYQSGSGNFANGKKIGTWTYRSARTGNQFTTTQNYTDGNLQTEEDIRYDAKGTIKEAKHSYTYQNGRLQKLETILYQNDGTTAQQKSIYNYLNGKLQASEAIIYQNDGQKTQKKSVFSYTDGKLKREDATTYKEDGTTRTSTIIVNYNNGTKQKTETTYYDESGTIPQTKEVSNYDNSGKEVGEGETYTYKDGKWEQDPY